MAVNLVGLTTINRTVLYRGQPGTVSGTLYTVPAATDAKISSVIVCNTTSASATITLSVVQNGGSAGVTNQIISAMPIGPHQTVLFDTVAYMNAGDFIAGLQGTNAALTLLISGETYA